MQKNNFRILLGSVLFTAMLVSCKHEAFVTPNVTGGTGTVIPTGPAGTVCFESDILPLFLSGCAKSGCHDAGTRAEGYVLDSYNNIVRKGISAGNAGNSKIYQVLVKSGDSRMPQRPNPAFTTDQINLIIQWINEGANNTTNCNTSACDTSAVTYSKSVSPIIQSACLGCHNSSLANGGYNYSTYAGLKSSVDKGRLLGAINYQAGFVGMPQGSHLTTCQIAIFRKWVQAGAPNN